MEKTKEERFENISGNICLIVVLGIVCWLGFYVVRNVFNAFSCEIEASYSSCLYHIQDLFSIIFKGTRA